MDSPLHASLPPHGDVLNSELSEQQENRTPRVQRFERNNQE